MKTREAQLARNVVSVAFRYDSLNPGRGTPSDPFNAATLSLGEIVSKLRARTSLQLAPGIYRWNGTKPVAFELPIGVEILGSGSDTTFVDFNIATTEPVDHFIGFRYIHVRSGSAATRVREAVPVSELSIRGLTMLMPDNARSTTAVQAFGNAVQLYDLRVVNASGSLQASPSASESFPLFASSRIPGESRYVPGGSCSVQNCRVMYRNVSREHYSTAITCDAPNSIVSNCHVNGRIGAAFTGCGKFSRCTSDGARVFWYHDTYDLPAVRLQDCAARRVSVFVKGISELAIGSVIAVRNSMFDALREEQTPAFFAYLVKAKRTLLEHNVMTLSAGHPGRFIEIDPSACGPVGLTKNIMVTDMELDQRPDVFSSIPGFTSKGNVVRFDGQLTPLYSDCPEG